MQKLIRVSAWLPVRNRSTSKEALSRWNPFGRRQSRNIFVTDTHSQPPYSCRLTERVSDCYIERKVDRFLANIRPQLQRWRHDAAQSSLPLSALQRAEFCSTEQPFLKSCSKRPDFYITQNLRTYVLHIPRKNMNWFKKETPKEAAMKAKREARREVRVSDGNMCNTVK